MKLLLDTHHSRIAAETLRSDGHDVLAASDDPMLANLPDDDLLRASTRQDRVLVTEDAKDFDRIVRSMAAAREHHAGVIFTSPRRYHRGSTDYRERLVRGLEALLNDPPTHLSNWIWWLP